MQKYCLEFILHCQNTFNAQIVKNSLAEFGEDLKITELCQDNIGTQGKDFKINLNTEDPTVIFDICAQFGRIRTIKVDEIK